MNLTLDHVKQATRFVVSRSVSTTVAMLIAQNTIPAKKHETIELWIGATVLGEIVAEKTHDYVNTKIDRAAKQWNDAQDKIKEAAQKK